MRIGPALAVGRWALTLELNALVFAAGLCLDLTNQFRVKLDAATEVTVETERRADRARWLTRAIERLRSPMH